MKFRRGMSLILVITILSALLALALPFALSMKLQDRSAKAFASEARARMSARAGQNHARGFLDTTHPAYERQRSLAQGDQASPGEDLDDLDELSLQIDGFSGMDSWDTRSTTGTILSVQIRDEQGKVNINHCAPYLLGNLLGATVLAFDVDEDSQALTVEDPTVFYTDNDPQTLDGIVAIERELIFYRHVDLASRQLLGLVRYPFDDQGLRHGEGSYVRDARYLKMRYHPLMVERGSYRPYETVSGLRQIANWPFVDLLRVLPGYRPSMFQPSVVRRCNLESDRIRLLGLDRPVPGYTPDEPQNLTSTELRRLRGFLTAFAEIREKPRQAGHIEALSSREMARLYDLVTVHSRPEVVWSDAQRINHDLYRPDERALTSRLRVADDVSFRFPSVVRLGRPGGPYQYRFGVHNPRGNGVINIWPWISSGFQDGDAFISARPPSPINLNTAPYEVLVALWSVPGRSPQGARTVARNILEARPLSNDIEHIGAAGFPLSEQSLRRWSLWEIEGGQPRCYESYGVFEISSTALEHGQSRNLLAAYRIREVVASVPPVETALAFDSQDDLMAAVSQGPVNDNNFWRISQGDLRRMGRAGNFVMTSPNREFQNALQGGDPSHAPGVGDLRIRHLPEQDNGAIYFESYNDRPEGRRFRNGGLNVNAGNIPVGDLSSPENTALGQGWAPFQVSCWVRLAGNSSDGSLFEVGNADDPYNQLLLSYDVGNQLLRLSLWDGCLDVAGGGRSVNLTANVELRPLNWYHILFQVWGTRAGEQTLFVDGKAVGEYETRTYLTAATDPMALTFLVDDASSLFPSGVDQGPVLVGREIVEVTRNGNTLDANRVVANPAYDPTTPQGSVQPPFIRGGSRGSNPMAHDERTVVQPFGYTAALTDRLPIGEAELAAPLDPVMPWTLGALADSVLTPILDSMAVSLPVLPELGTANFPGQGFLAVISVDFQELLLGNIPTQPNIEIVYYGSKTASTFEGLQRGLFPNQGVSNVNHYSLSVVVLLSLEVSDSSQYPDADAALRYPWVQLTNAPAHEWLHYFKGTPAGYDNYLILPVEGGNHINVTQRNFAPIVRGALQYFLRLILSQIPPGNAALPTNPNEIYPLPGVADSLIPYVQSIQPTTEITCRRNHKKGTSRQGWGAGTDVLPVFSTDSDLVRAPDDVTIADLSNIDPQREEFRILNSPGANPAPGGDLCAANALRLVAVDRFVGRDYEVSAAARMLKWPSGDLADTPPSAANFLQSRPGSGVGGPLPGDLDELAIYGLNVAQAGRTPGEGRVVQGTGVDIYHGPLLTAFGERTLGELPIDSAWRGFVNQGGLILIGTEVLGPDQGPSSGGGAGTPVVRGLLGTSPRAHSSETRAVRLSFPGAAQAGSFDVFARDWSLYSERGLRRQDGYVAVDLERGGGFGEVFPYQSLTANQNSTLLRRPLDELNNAVFRGAFGSPELGFEDGAYLVNIPSRFHSRYREDISSYDGVFYQFTVPTWGAWVDRISWDERRPDPLCGADIMIVVRVDNQPHWDSELSSAPRPNELYAFREPNRDNRIGRYADQLEVRVYFPYRPGSFEDDAWKTTPILDGIRIYTRQPTRVLEHEEGMEWR